MILRLLIAAIAVASAANAVAAAVVVKDRAAHAANIIAVSEQVAAVRDLASRQDSAGLIASLKATDTDQAMDSALRDYLLETTIFALSETAPTSTSRSVIEDYRQREVTSFIRLQDEHGNAVVPLYDLAAAARLTLRVWDTTAAKDRVTDAIRARRWTPADYLQAPTGLPASAWQQGTLQAIEVADRRSLVGHKAAVMNARQTTNRFDALLLAMARRLHDRELYDEVFTSAESHHALEAIGFVNQDFQPAAAAEILYDAAARAEVASAAILELGKLASHDVAVRNWLFNRLDSPADGASAALALARVANDDILQEVESLVLGDVAELVKLRAVLILRLSHSDAARDLRHDLRTRELSSEKLREALL